MNLRTFPAAFSIAGTLVLAMTFAATPAAAKKGDDEQHLRFEITLNQTSQRFIDADHDGNTIESPGPGDYFVAHYNVTEDGAVIGSASVFCMFFAGPPQCNVSRQLAGGDLETQSTNGFPFVLAFDAAVVGGTNRYRGARGEVTVIFEGDPNPGETIREVFDIVVLTDNDDDNDD